jgi:hypothetical protein
MESVCKHCHKRIERIPAPKPVTGCDVVWVHFTTRKRVCVLKPVYAAPVEEPYDHAAWMEANGPGR